MARSGVVTNRKKLDAFLRAGMKIERLVLRVGQLSGQPKYPKGHVGSKSRTNRRGRGAFRIQGAELGRRSNIRAAKASLQGLDRGGRKSALAALKADFKSRGVKAPTLARRSAGRTAVAKVAGVLTARSRFHVRAIRAGESVRFRENHAIIQAMLHGGTNVPRMMQRQGRNAKAAIRQGIKRAGHRDTGRLIRNTQFEIVDKKAKKITQAEHYAAQSRRQTHRRATKRRIKLTGR